MSGVLFGPRLGAAWRVLAAVFGSAVVAIAASVCLAFVVADPRGLGVALGVTLALPMWVAAMIPGFLARRAWAAWAGYVVGALVFGAIAWWLRRGS